MANIFDIQLPDGTKYNFADARIPIATASDANKVITVNSSGNYVLGTAATGAVSMFYGTCDTSIDMPNKVVVCPEFSSTDLVESSILVINFAEELDAGESGPIYLNVNGTGNKPLMWFVDHDISTSGYFFYPIPALCIYSTINNCWILMGPSQDLNDTPRIDNINGKKVNRYAPCSTAAGTAAKTASVTNGTIVLSAGLAVYVNFINANTASTPTLNIANLGAKNIFYNGAQITTGDEKSLLKGVCLLVYDGTQWHLIPSSGGGGGSSADTKVTQVANNSDADRPILVAYDTQSTVSSNVTNTVNKSSGKQFTFNTNTGALKMDKAQLQYNTTTNSLDFTFL